MGITFCQLDPSANAPWTSTIVGFCAPRTSLAVCAEAASGYRATAPPIAALPRTKRRELRGRDVRTRQGLAILLGSQKSSVPVKCCRQSSGGAPPDPRPKRRYAYVSTPVATNCVGAVMLLAWAWVSVATLATYAVRSDL